jgi:3-oxoacyl-[acyl-carrier-protein] synthase-3
MSQSLQRVSIAGTGSFLPGDPIPNDRIDDILGRLPDAPPRVQGFLTNVVPKMLASGGIESRHFAVDPETRRLTHTNVTLGEEAARRALDAAKLAPADVDLLLFSCPMYDYATPPSSTILQQRLGIEQCGEMEIHSNCSGVGKMVQIAYDAMRLGRYKTALIVYPQISSIYLRGCYFHQPSMNKVQAALRYILADGAGALVLTAHDSAEPVAREILGTYIESVGSQMEPGMTAGGGVVDLVDPTVQIPQSYLTGAHHLDQDFTAVNRHATPFLLQGVERMLQTLDIDSTTIDHYVYSIPGRQLYEANLENVLRRFNIQPEQARFRAAKTGYCGGASILLHFDEMVRSGEIQSGQQAVLHSVESSKWMSGGLVVRW